MHERLYKSLYRIRRVEEEIARVYPTDQIKSPVHLSIGQEAVAAGICEALEPRDIVFGTYRSHALYLAKGGDLRPLIAELYGREGGCARGKGGSMHLIDVVHGMMGTSAVVGTTIPNAVGYAYALRYKKSDAVVVSVFGDGGVEEGVWHESLNFAALKALPIIFVCENNAYAIHTHQLRRQPAANICERARVYGMPAEQIGDDVLLIAEKIGAAVRALREGQKGPFFFECLTYRWKEHVGPNEDFNLGYRTREEAEPWYASDQVRRMEALVDPRARAAIQSEVELEIRDALEFADASPFPGPAELLTDVFKDA